MFRGQPCEWKVLSCVSSLNRFSKFCKYFLPILYISVFLASISYYKFFAFLCNNHASVKLCIFESSVIGQTV